MKRERYFVKYDGEPYIVDNIKLSVFVIGPHRKTRELSPRAASHVSCDGVRITKRQAYALAKSPYKYEKLRIRELKRELRHCKDERRRKILEGATRFSMWKIDRFLKPGKEPLPKRILGMIVKIIKFYFKVRFFGEINIDF